MVNAMTKKDFTDILFKEMYELGYRKADVAKGAIFFYKCAALVTVCTPRVPIECTCFVDGPQCIDIAEYLGIIDWDKVEVDTPIFVRMRERDSWTCRHFAKYENGKVYAWIDGKTSWSNRVCDEPSYWECAKLAGDRA